MRAFFLIILLLFGVAPVEARTLNVGWVTQVASVRLDTLLSYRNLAEGKKLQLLPVAFSSFQAHNGSLGGCTTNGSDGFAGAPIGTPQFPNALIVYSFPPSWCVAGVGYAVGIPTGTSLSDPCPGTCTGTSNLAAALQSAGCTYPNPPNHVIVCSTASQTIQAWDFSLEGGWTLEVAAANVTVKNNNCSVGANARPCLFLDGSITSGTTTVINNVMNGNGIAQNPAGGLQQGGGPGGTPCGTVIIEYNLIENYYEQGLNLGVCASNLTTNITVNFNVFYRGGYGSVVGQHGDMAQVFSSNAGTPKLATLNMNYNLVLFDDPGTNWSSQGFSASASAGNTLEFDSEVISNNTILLTQAYLTTGGVCPCRNINDAVLFDTSWLNGTATTSNNYIDDNGISSGGWLTIGTPGGGPFSGTVTGSGNTNIKTGATCAVTGNVCPP